MSKYTHYLVLIVVGIWFFSSIWKPTLPFREFGIITLPPYDYDAIMIYTSTVPVTQHSEIEPEMVSSFKLLKKSSSPSEPMVSLEQIVGAKKSNNTVFITISTYAYVSFTLLFYQQSHMEHYSNFFVVVMEESAYRVVFSLMPCNFVVIGKLFHSCSLSQHEDFS